MNRILKLGMAVLVLLAMTGNCLAEGEPKALFDFVNAYQTPVTQPDLTVDEQQALIVHPLNRVETQYATYTVTDAMFDGRMLYVLVSAVPKADVLLLSGYGYEEGDIIWYEDSAVQDETFAQRAEREHKKLIVSCISSGNTFEEMSLEGESYSEAFYLDGTVQFYGRIPMDEERSVFNGRLQICEALYGAAYGYTDLPLRVESTTQRQLYVWQGEMLGGPVRLTEVTFSRSEISASLWVAVRVNETLSKKEVAQLRALEIVISPDIRCFSSGYYVIDEQGEMTMDDPDGSETLLFTSTVAAGYGWPEQLTISLRNYSIDETLGEFTVPLTPIR